MVCLQCLVIYFSVKVIQLEIGYIFVKEATFFFFLVVHVFHSYKHKKFSKTNCKHIIHCM